MSSVIGSTPKKRTKSPFLTPRSIKRRRGGRPYTSERLLAHKKTLINSTRKSPFTPYRGNRNKRSTSMSPFCPDRFIPAGTNQDIQEFQLAGYSTKGQENKMVSRSNTTFQFKDTLAKELFNGNSLHTKILRFKKPPNSAENFHNKLRILYSSNKQTRRIPRTKRYISSHPEKILDAPDILDDYYINVLDWSSKNILAVALGPTVYLWNASSGEISLLMENRDEDQVTSLKWMPNSSHIAIGSVGKSVEIWETKNKKKIRVMNGHESRVGALAWNNHILSSGSRDSNIFNHDVRIPNHHIQTYHGHDEEICGLEWNSSGTQLASGGNDNYAKIWDLASSCEIQSFEHKAAVKALAWCPFHRNLLASGAGTADRKIRFFNTSTNQMVRVTETNSQVCSLEWSKSSRELVSAHGFSQNQITVWSYPSMSKVAELTGHTARVLHTSLSPDGSTLCSAAADETLRFWKIFDPMIRSQKKNRASEKGHLDRSIR